MNFLTPDEQAEVRDMEEMFGTQGWKRFVQKHVDALDILPRRALAAKDEKELMIIKGQFAIMQQLVNYEDFYHNSIQSLVQERQVEADRIAEEATDERIAHAQGF